jgi:hypothetical protein
MSIAESDPKHTESPESLHRNFCYWPSVLPAERSMGVRTLPGHQEAALHPSPVLRVVHFSSWGLRVLTCAEEA